MTAYFGCAPIVSLLLSDLQVPEGFLLDPANGVCYN